jgi:hypothetical protein
MSKMMDFEYWLRTGLDQKSGRPMQNPPFCPTPPYEPPTPGSPAAAILAALLAEMARGAGADPDWGAFFGREVPPIREGRESSRKDAANARGSMRKAVASVNG